MINNLGIELAHKYQRTKVSSDKIPPTFPVLIIWQTNDLLRAQVIPYQQLQARHKVGALPRSIRFTFSEAEQTEIEQALFDESRYWQAAQTDKSIDPEKKPWASNMTIIERVNDKKMTLLVSRTENERDINIGWYTVSSAGWQPQYHLNRQGNPQSTYTLPLSIGLTAILWLAHRARLRRVAKRKIISQNESGTTNREDKP